MAGLIERARDRWAVFSGWADPDGSSTPSRRLVIALAYLSLVPMAALALSLVLGGLPAIDHADAGRFLVAVAAGVLAGLGGVRAGMALRVSPGRHEGVAMIAALAPVAVAIAAFLLPLAAGLSLLAAGYAGQGAWDVWTAERGQGPAWYGRLRLRLTVAMTAILVVAVLAA